MITIDSTDRRATAAPERTPDDRVQPGTRRLLVAFTVLTGLASNQLLVLGGQTDRFWPWTIHSRAMAACLGAAYAAGFVLSVLSLRQRSWCRIRVGVATVGVFTALTLVATIVHAHRLHFSSPDAVARGAAWVWLAVYVVVPAACLLVLGRQEQGRRDSAADVRRPMPGWLRWQLAGQGAVLAAAGIVLFVSGLAVHHHVEPTAAFWPWALTPLGAQVLGAWLIAFGVGSALVLRERDLSRLRVPAIAYTAFGTFELVVLVRYRTEATGPDLSLLVLAGVLVAVVGSGAYGWWASRR